MAMHPGSSEAADCAQTALRIDDFEREAPKLAEAYQRAAPFSHAVLDDVLRPDTFDQAVSEFAEIDPRVWHNYLHVNERKFASAQPELWGPTLRSIADSLMSDRFVSFLGALTGIDDLRPDPSMDGGGLHRSVSGGYLNIHSDFTAHHHRPTWQRRINLLLYLNPTWKAEWGGELEFWATDMSRCVSSVAPVGNRAVVFTTSEDSFHGHPEPMRCPPGVARQSLALYYFTEAPHPEVRATNYRSRPSDRLASSAAIFADNQVVHAFDRVQRRFGPAERLASRALGGLNRLRRPRS